MAWQILLAISVLSLSISVLLQRVLLHKDKSDPIAYVVIFQGLVAAIISVYALIDGFQMPDVRNLWFWIVLTIGLYGVGHIAYAKTLQQVEASVFSVLFATHAIWVMLLGFIMFGERLRLLQVAGALLILASVVVVAEKKGSIKFGGGLLLGLLTGLLFGIATAAWVYVGRYSHIPSWSVISFAGPALVVLLTHPRSVRQMRPFFDKDKLARMLLLGVLFSISSLTLLMAYSNGQASVVAPLQQTSIIVTVLFALLFLRERQDLWKKLIAATVCFAGVLLIVA